MKVTNDERHEHRNRDACYNLRANIITTSRRQGLFRFPLELKPQPFEVTIATYNFVSKYIFVLPMETTLSFRSKLKMLIYRLFQTNWYVETL